MKGILAFCFGGFSPMAAVAAERLVSPFIGDGSRTLATIEIYS
jgi:hypothetical protein